VLMVRNAAADHDNDQFVFSIRRRSTLGKLRKKASRSIRRLISSATSLAMALSPFKPKGFFRSLRRGRWAGICWRGH
jgi:hypothetical protein